MFHTDHNINIKTTVSQQEAKLHCHSKQINEVRDGEALLLICFNKCTLPSLRNVWIWSLSMLKKSVPFNQEDID